MYWEISMIAWYILAMWVQKCARSQVHHKICTNCIFTTENCPWSCDQSGEGSIFLFQVEYQQQQANTVLPRLKIHVYLAAASIFFTQANSLFLLQSLRNLFPTVMSHFQTIWQTCCKKKINKMFILSLFACPAHRTTLRQPTQPLPLYSIAGPQGPFVEESRCCWICQNKNGQRMLINHFGQLVGSNACWVCVQPAFNETLIDCCWKNSLLFTTLGHVFDACIWSLRSLNWVTRQSANSGTALFMELVWFCNSFERRQGILIINSIGLFILNSEAENKVNTNTRFLMIWGWFSDCMTLASGYLLGRELLRIVDKDMTVS